MEPTTFTYWSAATVHTFGPEDVVERWLNTVTRVGETVAEIGLNDRYYVPGVGVVEDPVTLVFDPDTGLLDPLQLGFDPQPRSVTVEIDEGAAAWERIVKWTDPDGAVHYREVRNDSGLNAQTFHAGGQTYVWRSDMSDLRGWALRHTEYDTSGIRVSETRISDDGIVKETAFRPDGTRAFRHEDWAEGSSHMDGRNTRWDSEGALDWMLAKRADGRLTEKTYEDGVLRSSVVYDDGGLFDWSQVRRSYDSTGTLTDKLRIMDPGVAAPDPAPGERVATTVGMSVDPLLSNWDERVMIARVDGAFVGFSWDSVIFDTSSDDGERQDVVARESYLSHWVDPVRGVVPLDTWSRDGSVPWTEVRVREDDGSEPWARIEERLDAAGTVHYREEVRDDGVNTTERLNHYSGQRFSVKVDTQDVRGWSLRTTLRDDEGRLFQELRIFDDDVLRTTSYHNNAYFPMGGTRSSRTESDVADRYAFSSVETLWHETYDLVLRTREMDDGRTIRRAYLDDELRISVTYDGADDHDWASIERRYDAAGALVEKIVVPDGSPPGIGPDDWDTEHVADLLGLGPAIAYVLPRLDVDLHPRIGVSPVADDYGLY